MTNHEIQCLVKNQQDFFKSGKTILVSFRIEQLKKLYNAIKSHEADINHALYSDLGKSSCESYMCEIGLVLSEISYMIKHTRKFAEKKAVHTPISQFYSHSFKISVPYGSTLIMSPWNYPFLLTLAPLAVSISAGNTSILKPSAYSPATSAVISKIIAECFEPCYISVVTGGREENSALLKQKFDLVFFTGSQQVGKEVLRCTAENLTPAILELGGKSPCIVDKSADIRLAAKRIVFGKYLNCGQTCVAPDYILCEKSVKELLVAELVKQINLQYGEKPLENPDYGKIISRKHFDRLCSLIDMNKVIIGGEADEASCRISPVIMDNVSETDAVMSEEIFGPILPVLTFENFDKIIDDLKYREKPLALYLFSENKNHIRRITHELSYGGGCINDVVIHLASSELGFGGVGESGMGSYHGKDGFDAFSHTKSIVHKSTHFDLPFRYQPYTSKLSRKLLHFFLK